MPKRKKEKVEYLFDKYMQAINELEQLEAAKEVIRNEIIDTMELDAQEIGDYIVKKIKRKKFKLTLEEAKEMGAVSTKEVINTKTLNFLIKNGAEIPYEELCYLRIENKYQ